jgi:hypothetical protein
MDEDLQSVSTSRVDNFGLAISGSDVVCSLNRRGEVEDCSQKVLNDYGKGKHLKEKSRYIGVVCRDGDGKDDISY